RRVGHTYDVDRVPVDRHADAAVGAGATEAVLRIAVVMELRGVAVRTEVRGADVHTLRRGIAGRILDGVHRRARHHGMIAVHQADGSRAPIGHTGDPRGLPVVHVPAEGPHAGAVGGVDLGQEQVVVELCTCDVELPGHVHEVVVDHDTAHAAGVARI